MAYKENTLWEIPISVFLFSLLLRLLNYNCENFLGILSKQKVKVKNKRYDNVK